MSVCCVNKMKNDNAFLKAVSAAGVTDESFAIFTTEPEEKCTAVHFLGLLTVTYLSWQMGTVIGAFASDLIPAVLTTSLSVSMYAMFIAILMPSLKHNLRLTVLVIVTAAVNAVLSLFIASSWSLIVSTIVCAAVGTFIVKDPERSAESYE